MKKAGERSIALLGLGLLLMTVAGCNTLINADLTVKPFMGGNSGNQILYLGINDAVKCGGCSDNAGTWDVTIELSDRAKTYSMRVDSTSSKWQSTGIVVGSKSSLSMHASGQIRYTISSENAAESLCGPNGVPGDTSSNCYLAPGLPKNSLVARVGTEKPFFVGTAYGSSQETGGEENYVPSDVSKDYFPLRVGSKWFLRDAKADWVPTHHASSTILQNIQETTTLAGVECYVLTTQVSDSLATYTYLHRTNDGVYEYGKGTDAATTIYSSPILKYKLPFVKDTTWTYQSDGETVTTKVLFQELVAISPTSNSPAQIYRSCWKLQINRGGVTSYEWYAPGVGRVKYVTDSINYELVDHNIDGLQQ